METDRENEIHRPIFILGSARSGTTLLQRMLNAHPQVAISGEHAGFLGGIARSYSFFSKEETQKMFNDKVPTQDGHLPQGAFWDAVKDPTHWSAWANNFTLEEVPNKYRQFILSFFDTRPGIRWGFKEIRYGLVPHVFPFLVEMFPKARFVVVVRHPVDVVLSQISTFQRDKRVYEELAERWKKVNDVYIELREQYPEHVLFYTYEDMCTGTHFEKVLEHCGIQERIDLKPILEEKKGRGADKKRDTREGILSPQERTEIMEIVKETAQKCGYTIG